MLGAQRIRATGFKRAQGNAHCAKFESNTNRMTFEYAPNMTIVNWNRFGKKTVLEGCHDDTLKWIYSAQPISYA